MKQILFFLALLFKSSLLIMNVWGSGKVSFTSDRTGNLDIYIIDINGKNLVNLTNHPSDDSSPTWSPDGRAFAYVSNRDGNPEIYVMLSMNTKESRRLTNHQRGSDVDPAWSPDGGQWIAFASEPSASGTCSRY